MRVRSLGVAAASATILTIASLIPASAASADQAGPMNAREYPAAAVSGDTTAAAPMTSVYSGNVAAGASQDWFVRDAADDVAYHVGFSPTGASTSAPCAFRVDRTWQTQLTSGERRYNFRIKNVGSIACGTDILVASLASSASPWSGALEPGATTNRIWNNANPIESTYLVNVSPSGATSSNPCQFEVTRLWYLQQPDGERELRYSVKNTGSIACTAKVVLARATASDSTWSTGTIAAGATKGWHWNNANPLTRIYALGLSPLGASGSDTCRLELVDSWYQQNINSDGSSEREYHLSVKNIGGVSCSGKVLLNYLDA